MAVVILEHADQEETESLNNLIVQEEPLNRAVLLDEGSNHAANHICARKQVNAQLQVETWNLAHNTRRVHIQGRNAAELVEESANDQKNGEGTVLLVTENLEVARLRTTFTLELGPLLHQLGKEVWCLGEETRVERFGALNLLPINQVVQGLFSHVALPQQ